VRSARHLQGPVARSASSRPPRSLGGGSASGTLARFEPSAQARRRSEGLAPAASHPPPQPLKRSVKGPWRFGPILKASMVGFTLLSRSYCTTICVDEKSRSPVPARPPSGRGTGGYKDFWHPCPLSFYLNRKVCGLQGGTKAEIDQVGLAENLRVFT
jgi:hypothetical protein